MIVRSAIVEVADATEATRIIQGWREQFFHRGVGRALASLLRRGQQEMGLAVSIDGRSVTLRPSSFAVGSFVLVFHRTNCGLEILAYDQRYHRFLQAVARLTVQERATLGGHDRGTQNLLMMTLVQRARALSPDPRPN